MSAYAAITIDGCVRGSGSRRDASYILQQNSLAGQVPSGLLAHETAACIWIHLPPAASHVLPAALPSALPCSAALPSVTGAGSVFAGCAAGFDPPHAIKLVMNNAIAICFISILLRTAH
jgi:hypothetical protein